MMFRSGVVVVSFLSLITLFQCRSTGKSNIRSSGSTDTPLGARRAEGYFCISYDDCQRTFKDALAKKQAEISGVKQWFVGLPETDDHDLQVGFAFLPSAGDGEKKLLIMSSGIHGLEGYTGSAVQQLFLQEMLDHASRQNIDVLMIHGINAYGMKNYRRHTVNRVDLNRNWFATDEFARYVDDHIYDDFDSTFNPKSQAPFSNLDFAAFITRSLVPNLSSIKSGVLTKAAGQGQYRYPKGISYGGNKAEPHRKIVTDVLDQFVPNYRHVLSMDLHTGLGHRELQLLPNPPYSPRASELRKAVFEVNGRKIQETGGADFYMSYGDFSDFVCQYSEAKYKTPTCANMLIEYGTLMPPTWEEQGIKTSIKNYVNLAYTLYAAVRENQAFHYGATSIEEGKELRKAWADMFNPDDSKWRQIVLDETRTLFPQFLDRFAALR